MSDILFGGERELQELKKIIQERARYNSVLASMYSEIESKQAAMDTLKENVEKEIRAEEQRRRDEIAKPFYGEIAASEVEIQRLTNARNQRRQELIDAIMREESALYEEKKRNLEKEIQLVRQEENVPSICLTRLFLAFFCPRTGVDALILVAGIVLLLLVLPMVLYYGVYGGNDKMALMVIYLVFIVFFYTAYLLINNLVKDKYLVGLQKILALRADLAKLEAQRKERMQELENIPDSELDLREFDDEIIRLELVISEMNNQKDMALATFESNERLKMEIAAQIQQQYEQELEQLRQQAEEAVEAYDKMQNEFDKYMEGKDFEDRYEPLLRLEGGIFNPKVIDELIFYICHGDADNIGSAIMKRKRKLGEA